MNIEEYAQMFRLESSHWYFVGKARMVRRLLSQLELPSSCRLLDVGCGTGNILDILSNFGDATGVDCSAVALEFCRERGLKNLHLGDASNELPFPDDSFDVVCAFDVLEHLDDDRKMLAEMKRVCKPGGRLLITVPALRLLWSEHDEALHHKRRYKKKEMELLVRGAGMLIRKLSYTNSLLFPMALSYRLVKRIKPANTRPQRSEFFLQLPKWINATLLGIFTLEGVLLTRMDFPIGVSIVSVCEK